MRTWPAVRTVIGGAALVMTCSVLLTGCRLTGEEAKPLENVVSDFFRFIAHTHPQPSTLHDVSIVLADAIDNKQSIQKALDEMAVTDDPYGKAITSAICTGLGQIADPNGDENAPSPTTADTWHDFLVDEISQVILKLTPVNIVKQKVDLAADTVSLATINPRLAATYYRECGGTA